MAMANCLSFFVVFFGEAPFAVGLVRVRANPLRPSAECTVRSVLELERFLHAKCPCTFQEKSVRLLPPPSLPQPPPLLRFMFNCSWLLGSIPSELGKFSGFMNQFAVSATYNEELSGTIPSELAHLGNVETLVVEHCSISGSITSELGRLTRLRIFEVNHNSLSGTIPSELAHWGALEKFNVNCNSLQGSISGFHWQASLKQWSAGANKLEGSLPAQVGRMGGVYLDLRSNRLEGHTFGEFEQLTNLILRDNSLQGSLPACANRGLIRRLDLDSNTLTGSIPTHLGKLQELATLHFSHNLMQGTIITEIANLKQINSFWAARNLIQGALPSELSKCNMFSFGLAVNRLEGTLPHTFVFGSESSRTESSAVRVLHRNRLSGKLNSESHGRKTHIFFGLTLHDNQLGGTVPEMRFFDDVKLTFLTLHGNFLSCKLPKEIFIEDLCHGSSMRLSSTLLGNFLSGPLPTWVPSDEQDPILYRNPTKEYVALGLSLVLGSAALGGTLWFIFGLNGLRSAATDSRAFSYDRWLIRTMSQITALTLCGFLPYYFVGSFRYECPRFPPDFSSLHDVQAEWALGGLFGLHYCLVCKCWCQRQLNLRMDSVQDSYSSGCLGICVHTLPWLGWAAIVLVLSIPSSFYTLMNSVPQQNIIGNYFGEARTLLAYQASALLGSYIQSMYLPPIANSYGQLFGFQRMQLEMWSKSISQWVIPSMVLLVMHENCLGFWRLMWPVCSSSDDRGRFYIPDMDKLVDDYEYWEYFGYRHLPYLTDNDMCELPYAWDVVQEGKCGRSVVDIMGSLLTKKFLAEAFLIPCLKLWQWHIKWRSRDYSPRLRTAIHFLIRTEAKWYRAHFTAAKCLEISIVWGYLIPFLQPFILLTFGTNLLVYRAAILRYPNTSTEDTSISSFTTPSSILILGLTLGACISVQVSFRIALLFWVTPIVAYMLLRSRSDQPILQHGSYGGRTQEIELALSHPPCK